MESKKQFFAFSVDSQMESSIPTDSMPNQKRTKRRSGRLNEQHNRKPIKKVGIKAENFQIDKYYSNKRCQKCQTLDDQGNMLLCDRCDDAYHIYCHIPPLECIPVDSKWLCSCCQKDIAEESSSHQVFKKGNCAECNFMLESPCGYNYIKEEDIGEDRSENYIKVGYFTMEPQICRFCRKMFHFGCFNERKNAVNCQKCQENIRKNSPKSFEQYCQYIESKTQFQDEFYKHYEFLQAIPNQPLLGQVHKCLGLLCPAIPTKTHTLIRSIMSLYYALETCRINFIDEQIYVKGTSHLNNKKEMRDMMKMHPRDEQAYEQFKSISSRGLFGNIQVAESKQLGFYVRALEYIPMGTILCEYVGEVIISRESLKQTKNKNIFSLIRTTSSNSSLDICPKYFGNMCLFFAGINNSRRHVANVQTMRVLHGGRVRVLLYAKKDIKPEEIVSMNYNGGGFKEYPTHDFE